MNQQTIHILLVEDSSAQARLIREHFKDIETPRFDITHVERLQAAVDKLNADAYDVVLLDLGLPDSQGVETLKRLRSAKPQQAVVVLTGLDDESVGAQLVQEGAQDYLVKNRVDSHVLIRSIRYAIERKRSENEKDMLEELLMQAQKLEAIGALAGGIAHDFNNLLGAISGYADLLKVKLAGDEKLSGYIAHIQSAAQRGARLTAKLLAFARKAKIVPRCIDMHKVIGELKDVLLHTLDKHITVDARFNAAQAMIIGDANEMMNALLNLAINARDAMPDGGALSFETSNVQELPESAAEADAEQPPNGYLKIRVSDTGVGMSESVLEHAFDPFFTTKGVGKGTGLGLASVYGCMKQHNGHITVESEVDKGTTFSLYLPCADAAEQPQIQPADGSAVTGVVAGQGRILFVDDEAMMRECASEMLSNIGYTVVCSENGEEAVKIFAADRAFDAVILDLMMPVMGGVECYKRLKQIDPSVRVIIISGYDNAGEEADRIRREAAGFLRKPFTRAALSQTLAAALSRKTGLPLES